VLLVSQDRFLEAIEHYRAAIRLHPDDANAEANLAALWPRPASFRGKAAFANALCGSIPSQAGARESRTIHRDPKNLSIVRKFAYLEVEKIRFDDGLSLLH